MILQPVTAWICPVCGYIHYGPEPPEECPVCATPGSDFEPYKEKPEFPAVTSTSQNVVIVGTGVAGVSAAEALRKTDPGANILLLSADPLPPYYRVSLTKYLAGLVQESDLEMHSPGWYAENKIDLRLSSQVSALAPDRKVVILSSTEVIPYDRLILCTGASPFVPPFPGILQKNVVTLRTREDADLILSICQTGTRVVCIGGGILGLENAGALARRGAKVTVLEDQPWLLPRMLNQKAAQIFETFIRGLGIHAQTGVKTQELTGEDSVSGVRLTNGDYLPADLVVITTGVRANTSLAKSANLDVNQGIIVDDSMLTSDANIYAAGDAVEHRGVLYGTWGPAQAQGTTAGSNAGGGKVTFNGLPRSNKLKVLGIDLYSVGLTNPVEAGDHLVEESGENDYTSYVFRANQLLGAILLGDSSLSNLVKKLVEEKTDLGEISKPGTEIKAIKDFLKRYQ
jgi:nitrite reductase (NADH) large subunit